MTKLSKRKFRVNISLVDVEDGSIQQRNYYDCSDGYEASNLFAGLKVAAQNFYREV